MIEDVYYRISLSDPFFGESLYFVLDADDEGRLGDFVGPWDQVASCEAVDAEEWGDAVSSGMYTWYTAYPSTGHSFWFLVESEYASDDTVEKLVSDIVESWEPYQYAY